MTNFASHVGRIADWMFLLVQLVLQFVLWAMIIFGLTEWWGMTWVITVLLPVALFIVVFIVSYRLIQGKWPNFFATIFGSLAGYSVVFLVFPWLVVFPVIFRFVEGKWPVTYLCLLAVLFVVTPLQEFFHKKMRIANLV